MTRKHGRILSVSLILLALISAMIVPGTWAENTVDADEIVNTVTDASLVSSPFTDVVGEVEKSVVGINNYQLYRYQTGRGFSARGQYETVEQLAATGSGVVVFDKYILTNYHVIEDAGRLSVSVQDEQEELEATLAAYDSVQDLAVLYCPDLDCRAVPLGDSDSLQVGEWAICIGNPLSKELSGTITVGIVSALDREIESETTTDRYGLKTTNVNTMIQTDAAINSGNSGGGLFNVLGQLMGVPTMKYSGNSGGGASIEGIGLAIPINSAKPLIRQAIADSLTDEAVNMNADSEPALRGSVRLGVTVSTVSPENNMAVHEGRLPAGVMIAEVEKNSPADKAGLRADDVIVEADGEVITGVEALSGAIKAKKAGDTITIKAYRADNLDEAEKPGDITGEYVTFEIELFEF